MINDHVDMNQEWCPRVFFLTGEMLSFSFLNSAPEQQNAVKSFKYKIIPERLSPVLICQAK